MKSIYFTELVQFDLYDFYEFNFYPYRIAIYERTGTNKQASLARRRWIGQSKPLARNRDLGQDLCMHVSSAHHQIITAHHMILLLLLRLNNLIGLCRLDIGHFFVLARSLLCQSRLSCCLCHLTLLGCLGFRNSLRGLTLFLYLVKVALGNGSSKTANLVDLGDIDSLCGILAFIIKPVLCLY